VDEDYQRLVDDVRSAQRAIGSLRGAADSDDGLISVTVDVHGSVLELELSPRIYRSPDSDRLAAAIVDTIERARQDVRTRAVDELAPWLPADADPDTTDLGIDPVLRQLRPRDHLE
jgi:DNA-binding protein YbaB